MELLLQCEAAAHKPRIAVLRHPAVGRSIAFSLDSTARLAATISREQLVELGRRQNLESAVVAASMWLRILDIGPRFHIFVVCFLLL